MDNRLYQIRGQRPSRLLRDDLPALARAMTAVLRGRGTVSLANRGGTDVVVLRTQDDSVGGGSTSRLFIVLKSDWLQIYPYVRDLVFDPQANPTGRRVGYLDPNIAYIEPILDGADGQDPSSLYSRVLTVLQSLFTEQFPTSNL